MKSIRLNLIASTALTAALINLSPISKALAAPQGGVVVGGSATISTSGAATNINQSTNRAAINWQSFNVDVNESVNFTVPNNGATLNRVIGNAASTIKGSITSNGTLYLVNPNGLVFDTTSTVTAQNFIATTGDINPTKFMEGGNITTDRAAANAKIDLRGNITVADRGIIGIFAPQVANSGTITANLGTVALGGVQSTVLNFRDDNLMSFEVSPTLAASVGTFSVENHGTIAANGGTVSLSAQGASDLLNAVIINDGLINVGLTDGKAGSVTINAVNGYINETGVINALGSTTDNDGTVTIASTGSNVNDSTLSGTIKSKDVTVSLGGSLTIKNLTTTGLANNLDLTAAGIVVSGTNQFSGDAKIVSTGQVDNAGITIQDGASITAKGSLLLDQEANVTSNNDVAYGILVQQASLSAGTDLTLIQNGKISVSAGSDEDYFAHRYAYGILVQQASLSAGTDVTLIQNGSISASGGSADHDVYSLERYAYGIYFSGGFHATTSLTAGRNINLLQNGAITVSSNSITSINANGIYINGGNNSPFTLTAGGDINLIQNGAITGLSDSITFIYANGIYINVNDNSPFKLTAGGDINLIQNAAIKPSTQNGNANGIYLNGDNNSPFTLTAGRDINLIQNGALTASSKSGISISGYNSPMTLAAGRDINLLQNGALSALIFSDSDWGIYLNGYYNSPFKMTAGRDINVIQNGAIKNAWCNGCSFLYINNSNDSAFTLNAERDINIEQNGEITVSSNSITSIDANGIYLNGDNNSPFTLTAGRNINLIQNGAITGSSDSITFISANGIYINSNDNSRFKLSAGGDINLIQNGAIKPSTQNGNANGIYINVNNSPFALTAGGDVNLIQNGALTASSKSGISIYAYDSSMTLTAGRDINLLQNGALSALIFSDSDWGIYLNGYYNSPFTLTAGRDINVIQNGAIKNAWCNGCSFIYINNSNGSPFTLSAERDINIEQNGAYLGTYADSYSDFNGIVMGGDSPYTLKAARDINIKENVAFSLSSNLTFHGIKFVGWADNPMTLSAGRDINLWQNFTYSTSSGTLYGITVNGSLESPVTFSAGRDINVQQTGTYSVSAGAFYGVYMDSYDSTPVTFSAARDINIQQNVTYTATTGILYGIKEVGNITNPYILKAGRDVNLPQHWRASKAIKILAHQSTQSPGATITPAPVVTSKDFRISYNGSTDVITNYSSYVPQSISVTGLTPVAASDVKVTTSISFDNSTGLYKTVVTFVTPGNANRNFLSIQKVDISPNAAGPGVLSTQIQLNVSLPSSNIQASTAYFGGIINP